MFTAALRSLQLLGKSIEIYDTFAEHGKEKNTLKYSISLRKLKTLAGNEICVSFEIQ